MRLCHARKPKNDRAGQRGGQLHIQNRKRPDTKDESEGQKDSRAQKRKRPVPGKRPGEQKNQHGGQQRRQGGRQAQGKCILPEQGKRDGGQLISRRGLLEVAYSEHLRRNPVAGFEHFARDFRIAVLIRTQHRAARQRRQVSQNVKGGENPEDSVWFQQFHVTSHCSMRYYTAEFPDYHKTEN